MALSGTGRNDRVNRAARHRACAKFRFNSSNQPATGFPAGFQQRARLRFVHAKSLLNRSWRHWNNRTTINSQLSTITYFETRTRKIGRIPAYLFCMGSI
jgi:hypothetical protein